jgi:hypothetical protein
MFRASRCHFVLVFYIQLLQYLLRPIASLLLLRCCFTYFVCGYSFRTRLTMFTAIRMRVLRLWSLAQTSFPHFVTTGTGSLSPTCYLPQTVCPVCACTCLKFYCAVDTIAHFCAVLQRGSHLHQYTASVCMSAGNHICQHLLTRFCFCHGNQFFVLRSVLVRWCFTYFVCRCWLRTQRWPLLACRPVTTGTGNPDWQWESVPRFPAVIPGTGTAVLTYYSLFPCTSIGT